MICLSTTATDPAGALEQLRGNIEEIELLELRADFFAAGLAERPAGGGRAPPAEKQARSAAETLQRFAEDARRVWAERHPDRGPLAVILTIRRERDGGRYRGEEALRLRILERAVRQGGYAYLDLEEDLLGSEHGRAVTAAAERAGVRIIRSFHAPNGVPPDLARGAGNTAARPGEIPKIAVSANGSADLLEILEAGERLRQPRIVIAMGPYGVAARILSPLLGSYLCYCSAAGGEIAAPGHLTPAELNRLYRYRRLGERTAVYAVIGDPVMHSRSPEFHNEVFRAQGLNAVYLPLQIDDLRLFTDLSRRLRLQGVSVTIPHKSAIRKVLSGAEPAVEAIAACNTALRRPDGSWYGYNSDLAGFLAPLAGEFGRADDGGPALEGVRCTVIGAGGAARAAVYGLLARGAEVLILNRTPERAEALAAGLAGAAGAPRPRTARLERAALGEIAEYNRLLVQTTSIGMEPDEHSDPLEFYEFTGEEVAYDIVYTPPETLWLRRARRAGCRVIGGRAMFEAQAASQSALFLAQLRGEQLPARAPDGGNPLGARPG